MNDPMRELQRQLEAATAPGNGQHEELDPETASLRQGWLALGEMLDAVDASLDEPSPRWRVPAGPSRSRPHSAIVAVLAASLLIGISIAWLVFRFGSAGPSAPGPEAVAVEKGTPPVKSPGRPEDLPEQDTLPADVDLKWDDSLDDQIVSAAQAVMSTQQNWNSSAGSVDYILYGLEQVEEDIDSGSL